MVIRGLQLQKEKHFKLDQIDTYLYFPSRVIKIKNELVEFLNKAKNECKKIVGYGAPAKGNTLLNYCEINSDLLPLTVDKSHFKQNRYLPGTHIPIYHPDKIKEEKPDYLLMLPWNLKDEIIEQMAFIREWHGKFVVPIPSLEIF